MQHLINFVHGADVIFGVLFGNVASDSMQTRIQGSPLGCRHLAETPK